MRKALFALVLLSLIASPLLAQSNDAAWKARIRPSVRNLADDVRVLWLTPNNIDLVWALEDDPGRADVVVLALSPEDLSTAMVTVIRTWASAGNGIIATSDTIAKFAEVDSEFIGDCIGNRARDHYGPEVSVRTDHALGSSVGTVFLEGTGNCSYGRTTGFVRRRHSNFDVIGELADESESLNGRAMIVAGALEGGGRYLAVAYGTSSDPDYRAFVGMFDPESSLLMVADNARFYINSLLWLSGHEVP